MASLKEYFEIDFSNTIKVRGKVETNYQNKKEYGGFLSYDFTSNSLFKSYYFEDKNLTVDFFINFIREINEKGEWNFDNEIKLPTPSFLKGLNINIENTNPLKINVNFPGESNIDMAEVGFYGRIFLYSETQLTQFEISKIRDFAKSLNIFTQFRSIEFSKIRNISEKKLAFISHDSRDKEIYARPLSLKLQQNECPVWYDEYSLNIGDSLRESIEKGIKECSKCVLILSPNFLKNGGWTKAEFNSIFTRQILEEKKLILPIWAGIDKHDVYEYSPSLLDIVGIQWDNIDTVVSKLLRVLNE
ncbi:toll/interleukin-1 receptor domain-containing protein [Flavobacterium branchiophilum]|uniref:TIR domain-containing protein n=1 Tax=Flavobacterium branchiophilum TaxID=55197 RepID=A0A2H3KKP7_9FLAO|nr:toll/interleukin-1 receptor domain-containing protein [Flavobacterium branchiophilum]PDS23370.1 hypothetical protein B0A77_10995 [Flavobacterium branchiophilum]